MSNPKYLEPLDDTAPKRKEEFDAAVERLKSNADFRRFIAEVLIIQPLDDACFSDNPTIMAYTTGRRSVVLDIKRMFADHDWHLIESFNVNE